MTITPKEQNEFEAILSKHFNELMPGVRFRQITFEQWKVEYATLYKVIMESMKEVSIPKPRLPFEAELGIKVKTSLDSDEEVSGNGE